MMCASCTTATRSVRAPIHRVDSLRIRPSGKRLLRTHVTHLAAPSPFPFPYSPAIPLCLERGGGANCLFLELSSRQILRANISLRILFSRLKQCPVPTMSGRRFDINARKCGMHSTPSTVIYLDTTDSEKSVYCQSTYNDADSCAVKHHFPSPIISWIEDVSSFGDASFVPDTQYVDEQARSSLGHSSTSSNLHDMQISLRLTDEFMELAKENMSSNLETCGILGASFRDGTYFVTMLIIPKQEGTAHSCQAVNEEEIHAVLSEQSLYPAGWIHTHPSQTCFLSSIDLHTQYSYQVMLPEAVAIVVAPTDPTRSYGIFRLTVPGGMDVLRECDESGFHTHRETTDGSPIYETCSNVHFKPNLRFEIVDLRSAG